MLRKLSTLFLVVCIFFSGTASAQPPELSVDKQHIFAVAQSHIDALEGWRTGDLLIRSSTTGDGKLVRAGEGEVIGPGALSAVVREDYLARIVFDFDQGRALVINRCEREEQLFNSLDEELQPPKILVDNRVLLYDKAANIELLKKDAGVIHRAKTPKQLPDLIAYMGVPDLRNWGCAESPGWNFEVLQSSIEFNNAVQHINQLEHIGKNVYRVVAKDLEGTRKFRGQYVTDWDLQRNLPVKFMAHHVPATDNKPPVRTVSVEWKLINDGFYVPESARISKRGVKHFADNPFHLKEETTVEVHWFSFNEELSADFFDEDILQDRKRLDELLKTDALDTKPVEPSSKK